MADPTPAPGRTLARDDAGYETARRDTVWRTNVPDRFPVRIVQANSVADVVAAVRAAEAVRPAFTSAIGLPALRALATASAKRPASLMPST